MESDSQKPSRRKALKTIGASAMAMVTSSLMQRVSAAERAVGDNLKGKINHSVCRWCYNTIPLEDLVVAAKQIGLKSVELLGADQWPIAIKHGLTCAMGYATSIGLNKGFNDPSLHAQL